MERLVLNHAGNSVKNEDVKVVQNMKIFQDLEAKHPTQYTVKILAKENNYIDKDIKYTLMYFINRC